MAEIKLESIHKAFDDLTVIKGVDIDINDGEFVVFVGPSGSGKSTLLRMIAGLEDITSGLLTIDGEEMNDVPPSKRELAMVFQSYALYPHMNVFDNLAFGLKLSKIDKLEIKERVEKVAEVLQIHDYLKRLLQKWGAVTQSLSTATKSLRRLWLRRKMGRSVTVML